MGWIAVTGDGHNWIDASLSARRMTGIDRAMLRGTIMIETEAPTLATGPALIRLNRAGGAQGVMSLQWVPAMGLVLILSQRHEIFHATLPITETRDRLRLSYAWDLERGTARLAAENPTTGAWTHVTLDNPLPIFLSDFWSLTRGAGVSELGDGVAFLAVSEAVEPIGPQPTLDPTAKVRTAKGMRRLETLNAGDTVVTMSGDTVPVLMVVKRTVPSAGSFRPMRLRPPALSLSDELLVAPAQRVVIADHDLALDYDAEAVCIASRDLPSHCAQPCDRADTGPLISYVQLILPDAQPVMCNGAAMESLNIGHLRRDGAEIAQTLLAGTARNHLPEHTPCPYPVLAASEALVVMATEVA